MLCRFPQRRRWSHRVHDLLASAQRWERLLRSERRGHLRLRRVRCHQHRGRSEVFMSVSMAAIQAEQEQNRNTNTYICHPVSQWVWLWSRHGRNRTEIRTSVTRYVSEYGCDPGRAGTEQKYVHLSPSMSVSMAVIKAGQEQKYYLCQPVCQWVWLWSRQSRNRNAYLCHQVCLWVWLNQTEQEQKYVPLSFGMSVSMTEIRTYVTRYFNMTVNQAEQEQKCVPVSPGMSMNMTVIQAEQEQKYVPLSPGMPTNRTKIRTSVTRYVSEYELTRQSTNRNTYLCDPVCQWVWLNQAEHKQKYFCRRAN